MQLGFHVHDHLLAREESVGDELAGFLDKDWLDATLVKWDWRKVRVNMQLLSFVRLVLLWNRG